MVQWIRKFMDPEEEPATAVSHMTSREGDFRNYPFPNMNIRVKEKLWLK